jgi:transcriptional regulator
MADREFDLLQGTLDMLLLKALQLEPLHGYAIARRVQQLSQDALKVEEGSLYPALHRMEERGFVESEWGASENNRRARFYRLTRKGRRQLETEAAEWRRLALAISRVMGA